MNDKQLVEELLGRLESDDLDFKQDQYHLAENRGKSNFIKDVLAMANTPRSRPAHILIGVREESGKAVEVLGVSHHLDPSELGRTIAGRVLPMPRFEYRIVRYESVELGIIEIATDQPDVFVPRIDFGVLRKSTVYVRRNATNVEADSDDLRRLFGSIPGQSTPDMLLNRAAWEQFYRDCDEFDPRRTYIAIVDADIAATGRDWAAMASVGWNLILDFDRDTDTEGHYAVAEIFYRDRRATHLSALDQSLPFTPRSTMWVAAAGLNSRPTTNTAAGWREWNRIKARQIESVIAELALITEPTPSTLVIFSGDPAYVTTICEIADRVFLDRLDYVVATPDYASYESVSTRFDAANVAIPFGVVCEGLREVSDYGEPLEQVAFPQLDGGSVVLSPDRARWFEEQLEPVQMNPGSSHEQPELEDAFLKGSVISWDDLESRTDAERDLTQILQVRVHNELKDRATRRLNLWHRPGAGATTVARRIAWNLRQEFPTVIALDIQPQETAERVQHLFGITRSPVLIVIDLPQISQEVVDRFYVELSRSHIPAVLFNIQRRFQNRPGTDALYLDAVLSNLESVRLADILSRRVPAVRSRLETLVHDPDRRKRSPFYFGLTAFGRDFIGLETFVEARLSIASPEVRKAVVFLAFAYYYGQVPLSLQAFAPLFNISASRIVIPSRVFPEQVRELLVEENQGVRPAHYLIAEEILNQELGKAAGERRNWRVGLADLAIEFIDLLSRLPQRGRGPINDILRATLIERERNESPAGSWDDDFSRFLNDIPSDEGKQRALEHLTETFPEEPHFWAHLGRFYSRVTHEHGRAHSAHGTAIKLMYEDSRLHHMAGMGWRAELYDLLSSMKDDPSKEEEAVIFEMVEKASNHFDAARELDKRNDHNYISHVQMLQRVVGAVSVAKGYPHDTVSFITSAANGRYREMVDEAENLLSDLQLIKGNELPSQMQVQVAAQVDSLYGNRAQAIEKLTNLLDRSDTYRPPIRRALIRNYVARRQGDWSTLLDNELARVVGLANDNIREEPTSDYNLRLWLRAIRTENALNVDRVAEHLAYKNLQSPSLETKYYLYITKFLQLEAGDYGDISQVLRLIEECGRAARDLSRTSSPFEWLGSGPGLKALVHVSTLGPWNQQTDFWQNQRILKRVTGRIATIRHQGSGEIELPSGLRAFFAPSRGKIPGGYVAGQDIGREVGFFLGFSYDGLRAWEVGDHAQ